MVMVFIPYVSMSKNIELLDLTRLGKQREEILIMLETITNPARQQYQRNPTVNMWRPFASTLCTIGMMCCREYASRGRAETALPAFYDYMDYPGVGTAWVVPPWMEDTALHLSHRSRMIVKKPEQYVPLFGDKVPKNMPYLYPRLNEDRASGYSLHIARTDLARIAGKERRLPPQYRLDVDTLEVTT